MGDRFTHEEVDDMYKEAPIKGGHFDYVGASTRFPFFAFSDGQ